MNSRTILLVTAFVVVVAAIAAAMMLTAHVQPHTSVRVLKAGDVEWQSLNPLRGDKSPRAGTLWGDRGAPVPCGFLVKFVDGFSSPPHIHPVTYRGVVISGLVHNDDPKAAEEWLPSGTFWTQPAGEVHITAAKGTTNIAYIEIEKGPYLVLPSKEAFERPEDPIKQVPTAMAWKDADGGSKLAALAGNPGDDTLKRWLLKLPAGFKGSVQSNGPELHAVVIQGPATHEVSGTSEAQSLDAGSYFGSEGEVTHAVSVGADAEGLVYIRTTGTFTLTAD